MDPYEVLGVPRSADAAAIRKAYLRLARLYHPDGHATSGAATRAEAEARMRQVNEAWAVLGDPARRAALDGRGADEPSPARPSPPPGPGWRPRAGDTAWMDDFDTWKHETDDLLPPEDEPSDASGSVRGVLTTSPVVVLALALAAGCMGLVLQSRVVLAVAFVGGVAAAALVLAAVLVQMRGPAQATRNGSGPRERRR